MSKTMVDPQTATLALKQNNCGVKDNCLLCGEDFRPECGWAIFPLEGWQPVCDGCALQRRPDLFLAREVANAASADSLQGEQMAPGAAEELAQLMCALVREYREPACNPR